MGFTEGQAASAWQTGTTNEIQKAAADLVDPDRGQATVPDYPESVGIDNRSGSRAHGRADSGLLCGLCEDFAAIGAHIAIAWATPVATFGPSDHGWHNCLALEQRNCDLAHGLCARVPGGKASFAQGTPSGLTDAIAEAVAGRDVEFLASLLELPTLSGGQFRRRDATARPLRRMCRSAGTSWKPPQWSRLQNSTRDRRQTNRHRWRFDLRIPHAATSSAISLGSVRRVPSA